jgi:hypothetical protein
MIIAVDPGKITGLCTYDAGEFRSWQTECWDAIEQVHELLKDHSPPTPYAPRQEIEAVVCEDYLITPGTLRKTRGENWSMHSIGALMYLCRIFEVPFVLQTPADAKRFATDSKLKAAGFYHPSTGGHANDSARHLVTFLANTKRLDLII